MEKSLNDRIKELEQQVKDLASQLRTVHQSVKGKGNYVKPYSKVSPGFIPSQIMPGKRFGMPTKHGGGVLWNDADAKRPPYKTEPGTPTEGYNKHGHSRYSGGALPINTLELVEYSADWLSAHNKHCQSFWTEEPEIKKSEKEGYETVEKIGNLNIEFDPSTKTWLAGGVWLPYPEEE